MTKVVRVREALRALLLDGKPDYCEHAYECFSEGSTGLLHREDPDSNAYGGVWFTRCTCASAVQREAAAALAGQRKGEE